MKKILFLFVAMMLVSFTASAQKKKDVKVKSANEFILALKNQESSIVLDSKEPLNLTKALEVLKDLGRLKDVRTVTDKSVPGVYYFDDQDGLGLVICGFTNLSIKGKNPQKSQIVIDPRFPDVLSFENCVGLTLQNVTFGHTLQGDMGWCHGDVLSFKKCRDVKISNCSLFGCGVCGIDAEETVSMKVEKTEIHHCSWDALHLFGDGFVFNDCTFHHNNGFGLFHADNIVFNNCTIRNIDSELFGEYSIYSPIVMNKCKIVHHGGFGPNVKFAKFVDCDLHVDEDGEPDGYSSINGDEEGDGEDWRWNAEE